MNDLTKSIETIVKYHETTEAKLFALRNKINGDPTSVMVINRARATAAKLAAELCDIVMVVGSDE